MVFGGIFGPVGAGPLGPFEPSDPGEPLEPRPDDPAPGEEVRRLNRNYRIVVWGRGRNQWLLKIEDLDPATGLWVAKDWQGWGPFWTQFRAEPKSALLAEGAVAVSPVDDEGTPVTEQDGWLLKELGVSASVALDSSGIVRGTTDIFGRNPAGKVEHIARGTWLLYEATTEVPA